MKGLKAATIVLAMVTGIGVAAQDRDAAYEAELQRGNHQLDEGHPDQALQAFKRAKYLKESAAACLGMAVAYQRLGAFKNALESGDEALKRAPGDRATEAAVRNVRGSVLASLAERTNTRKLKEAESEFRAAIAAGDTVPAAHFNLGTTLIQLHRVEEGVRELKEYLRRVPTGQQAEEAQHLIEDPQRARVAYAPDFSITTRHGDRLGLAELKGKVVLLDFWGSWCAPCVQAAPGLAKIAKRFSGDPVTIIGIAQDQPDAWNRFIEKHQLTWPQYLDDTQQIARLFGVQTYPTYIILDPGGIVQARRSGYGGGTDSWIEKEIKKALDTAK